MLYGQPKSYFKHNYHHHYYRLLKYAFFYFIGQNTKQVDSTFSAVYNIRWQKNFTIQVVGYSDHNKRFQPTMVALSSTEDEYVYGTIFDGLKSYNYRYD